MARILRMEVEVRDSTGALLGALGLRRGDMATQHWANVDRIVTLVNQLEMGVSQTAQLAFLDSMESAENIVYLMRSGAKVYLKFVDDESPAS